METREAKMDGGPEARRESLRLSGPDLRWCCDEAWLDFETTASVKPISGIVGQDDAIEALRFGIEISGSGQNVFVRGLPGTGRLTLVRQLLNEMRPEGPTSQDRCYVHNFQQPDIPRLLALPPRHGKLLSRRLDHFVDFVCHELGPALASEGIRARRAALDEKVEEELRDLGKPLENELQADQLALVPVQAGQTVQPAILPVVDGSPVTPDKLLELRAKGTITSDQVEKIFDKISVYSKKMAELGEKVAEVQNSHRGAVQRLYEEEARRIVQREIRRIQKDFPQPEVAVFLDEVVEDLISERLQSLDKDTDFVRRYRVNVVLSHDGVDECPVVVENSPTMTNLLGVVEREFLAGGVVRSNHMMIRAGSLLRADGGYLVMEARDVLSEPGAWKILVRTLRTGRLEIVPSELAGWWAGPMLKPESIDIKVKVILLGDPELYYALDAHDPDFSQLFKVLADFDTTIERNETGVRYYAGILARIAREERLLPFARDAVAALAEHGARIAARRDRLTTRFGRLTDVAREAVFLAQKDDLQVVSGEHVRAAIERGKRRADRPARRFRKLVADGVILIQVGGREIGQVNGLAVIHAGPLTYGFPSRITATIGAGTAGTIDIERESNLSGAIHTKGFYILGGLLRSLFRTSHPLAFSASIAFEQSYGGIDGDSASGAEMCCLLSALARVPLRQDLAMTGAIDQIGHVQPVGAVTEKIEGFFDTCQSFGELTGTQGVIIPRANLGDLMLRRDIVEACERDRFRVYAVETIQEALELFTGQVAGTPDADGGYPAGTLLGVARQRAEEYWRMASSGPTSD